MDPNPWQEPKEKPWVIGGYLGSAWHENKPTMIMQKNTVPRPLKKRKPLGILAKESLCFISLEDKTEVAGNRRCERLGCDGDAEMQCSHEITHKNLAC